MTSQRPSSNRTRNSTFPMPGMNSSRFNESDFDRNNSSRPGMMPVDESPEGMLYLLSALALPSICCFAFLFYNFLRLPELRSRSTNLTIICLLIINFVHLLGDLPLRLYYLSQNVVIIQNPVFCQLWTWFDNILTTADLFVLAWTSIERYLFVFHHGFHRHHKRWLSRVPIVMCLAIPVIWYSALIFGFSCRNDFKYFTFQCGTSCYLSSSEFFLHFENFGLFIFPLAIVFLANGSLIVHVCLQKSQMKSRHRVRARRNNLRMISQLVVIAILYMSVYVPSCILLIFGTYVRRGRFQPWALSVRARFFTHLKYLIIYGCPFVILAGQRDTHDSIKGLFFCVKNQRLYRWKTPTVPVTVGLSVLPATLVRQP